MVWSDDMIRRLEELWAKGTSASVIGKELGVSKNAVIGKSRRLKLPARPSPIVRAGEKKSVTGSPRMKRQRITDIIELTAHLCRWPFGNPDEEDFYFCGKAVVPGKPYCQEHSDIAYVAKSGSRDRAS